MRQHALFLLPALLIPVLAVAMASGCTATAPVRDTGDSTARAQGGDAPEPTVMATTTDASSGVEATVGVASTTEQAEVSQEEALSSPSGETSSAEEPVEEAPVEPSGARVSQAPFIADPQVRGGAGYGADSILGVRYGIHEGYERVVIDLGAGGQTASSIPDWVLSSPTGDGLLRVTIPSVSMTRVSGGELSGPLLKNFHVVRAPEGGMFVDVFSEAAFTYRVIELLNPARIVVDFKPSSATLDLPLPAERANTVLVEPRRGARVSGSLTVSGYSRNPEASNTLILTDASGRELMRETIMSNDWTNTWGYFETTLDLPPFSGRAKLKVGAQSARDGTFEGVEIPVYVAR